MKEIAAANESEKRRESLTRRIMPEAVLVCAVRLPVMPEPSGAARDILGLFGATGRSRPCLQIVD